jgi:diguanylate cyclase (GGDEF)-like protein
LERSINEAIAERRPFSVIYRLITRSGETRWAMERGQCIYAASGEPAFLEGFISDITQQRQTEERLRWVAHHDPLTGAPNRVLFQERLEHALKRSARTGLKVGLLLLDVDHLKEINDTLGHDAGDALLQVTAKRLATALRSIDTVARNGGDEFAVILPDIESEQDLWTLLKPVLDLLQEPFSYAGRAIDCRASIGASIWPDHAKEAAHLLKQADVALYTAKAAGRGRMMVFRPSMRAGAERRVQMRSNAHGAIKERRIEPFYQPKVLLQSGELAGFEALLRWRNPEGRIETPATIKAAFDDPQLAVAIGRQMHELVFDDLRRWLDAGHRIGHVAINASAAEFRGNNFAEEILERLRAAAIPTHYLELEVTETVFLGRGAEHVERALRTLSLEGVRISLDDFGTGYASLSHLKQFPVDVIKIDRSFVQDLAHDPDDTAILQAVLNLGRALGLTTVAEGIETGIQAAYLRSHGCNLGQGHLFGRAVPRGKVPGLIATWEPHHLCSRGDSLAQG